MGLKITVRPASSVPFGTALQIQGGGGETVASAISNAVADDTDYVYRTIGTVGTAIITTTSPGSMTAGAVPSRAWVRVRCGHLGLGGSGGKVVLQGANPPYQGVSVTTVTWSMQVVGYSWPLSAWPTTANPIILQVNNTAAVAAVSELYVDLYEVQKPTVVVEAPAAGPWTDRNTFQVTWSTGLDSEGGGQHAYQVKIFDDANYPANQAAMTSSTAYDDTSGIVEGSAAGSWQNTVPLVNDTYKAYVRVAQLVNGSLHWSDWDDGTAFTVNVGIPAVPTLSVADDAANGRISISVNSGGAGTATTDLIEVQRSYDGGASWEAVRTRDGGGLIDDYSASPDVYDYEAPNGTVASYRARAVHDYTATGGIYSYSAWSSTQSDTWTSTAYWLKHPYDATKNISIRLASPATGGISSQARVGVHQPLGAAEAIAITDTPLADTGQLKIRCDSDAERVALDALLDEGVPLLFGTVLNDYEPNRWIAPGNHTRTRLVDAAPFAHTWEEIEWTEVAAPEGTLV